MPKTFLDTAIPIILVLIMLGFIWAKGKKHWIALYEWLREVFKSKKPKAESNSNSYSYIDYE